MQHIKLTIKELDELINQNPETIKHFSEHLSKLKKICPVCHRQFYATRQKDKCCGSICSKIYHG